MGDFFAGEAALVEDYHTAISPLDWLGYVHCDGLVLHNCAREKKRKTFPQALKRSEAADFMLEPFPRQDELKLRPPRFIVAEELEQNEQGRKLGGSPKPTSFLQGLKPAYVGALCAGAEAPAS